MKKRFDQGASATFVVRIQNNQNGTWQGRITYADEERTQYFRSMLEMIKLIDDAVGQHDEIKKASNE